MSKLAQHETGFGALEWKWTTSTVPISAECDDDLSVCPLSLASLMTAIGSVLLLLVAEASVLESSAVTYCRTVGL